MENCIFCSIIEGKIPCQKVFEDEFVLAFKDIQPVAPIHIIIIPKKHIESINNLQDDDNFIIGHIFNIAKIIAHENNLEERGYRVVNNCGADAGQTVPHIHFHLIGGRSLNWPPG